MKTDAFPDTIDFWVMQVSKLHFARVHALFAEVGLYPGQPPFLFLLWERDGRSQSELAACLNIKPATVTKMVARLEKAGFIRRETDAGDQRVSLIYLTAEGRQVQARVEGIFAQMDGELAQGFTLEEQAQLRNFLVRLQNNLSKAGRAEVGHAIKSGRVRLLTHHETKVRQETHPTKDPNRE
jgi:MarR family transcriptional regulator, organic hydroperoxide resistance regulator